MWCVHGHPLGRHAVFLPPFFFFFFWFFFVPAGVDNVWHCVTGRNAQVHLLVLYIHPPGRDSRAGCYMVTKLMPRVSLGIIRATIIRPPVPSTQANLITIKTTPLNLIHPAGTRWLVARFKCLICTQSSLFLAASRRLGQHSRRISAVFRDLSWHVNMELLLVHSLWSNAHVSTHWLLTSPFYLSEGLAPQYLNPFPLFILSFHFVF